MQQREYPNRLVPAGASRDLAGLLQSAERGQQVVASQRYHIRSWVVSGDTVALEVDWSARLRVAIASLPPAMRCALPLPCSSPCATDASPNSTTTTASSRSSPTHFSAQPASPAGRLRVGLSGAGDWR